MLRSEPVIGEVIARSTGVSYPAINPSDLISIKVPVPRTDDQSAIKEFLDCETAKIDVLISEQQDLIALLREKRQAVISHTVTKGLNPNVPMKYSGIEWLGDVPEHWKVIAIKHIVSTPITDGPHETPDFPDEGIPFVSAEAIATGEIDFEKVRGFISRHDHLRYSQKYSPQIGDIYMVKSGATTGITAIVETDIEFNIWSPLAAIRCGESAIPKYILYFLRSKNFQDAVSMYWSFGTQQNIGMGVIENLSIALPPKKEQEAAVSFVDHQIDKIETLISDAESIISLLQEHRIALISAVVTGKVDVREVAYV
jgi:type I restriction enzyme S subunit